MVTRSGPVTRDASTVPVGLAKILIGKSQENIDQDGQVLDEKANSMGAMNSTSFTSEVDYWTLESGLPLMEDSSVPLRERAFFEIEFKEINPRNLAIARGIDPGNEEIDSSASEVAVHTEDGNNPDETSISTNNNGGVIDEEYTISVVSTGPLTVDVYGKNLGKIVDGQDISSSSGSALAPTDGDGNERFSIPTGFMDTSWAVGELYIFETTAHIPADNLYTDNHSGTVPLGTISTPDYVRTEAIYTYPNKVNKMVFVFPRAQVTSSVSLGFAQEDNPNVPCTLEAKRADSGVDGIDVTTWDDKPLGHIFFE